MLVHIILVLQNQTLDLLKWVTYQGLCRTRICAQLNLMRSSVLHMLVR